MTVLDIHPSYRHDLDNKKMHLEILLFANLLLLGRFTLVLEFLSTASLRTIYQHPVVFNLRRQIGQDGTCSPAREKRSATKLKLEGCLVDVMAQICCLVGRDHDAALRFACDRGSGHFDPSRSLSIAIETHYVTQFRNAMEDPHERLAELVAIFYSHGAALDFAERPLTLLQLVVANVDLLNTRKLLELGAEPKQVGNSKNPPYAVEPLCGFNRFRGQSALGICRTLMQEEPKSQDNEEKLEGIFLVLTQAGGRDFFEIDAPLN